MKNVKDLVFELFCDGSVKWFKPMNLAHYANSENEKEDQLYALVYCMILNKGFYFLKKLNVKKNILIHM